MKLRNGFVSNSSSSSFIIATKDSKEGKFTITVEADISEFATRISTLEELDAYIIEEHGWSDITDAAAFVKEEGGWLESRYNDVIEAIKAGKVVWWGNASYNETDNPIELMIGNGGLRQVAKDSDIEIISEDY